MTQQIYRIQHKSNGQGVYRWDVENSDYRLELNEIIGLASSVHPMPLDDDLFKSNYKKKGGTSSYYFGFNSFIFGFESLDQLSFWFYNNKMIDFLIKWDFELVIYKSDNFILGSTQVAFEKESAKLIEKKELDFLKY